MTEADVKKALEEAEELAQRFPAISDHDVIEHVEFVCMIKVKANSILEHNILQRFYRAIPA